MAGSDQPGNDARAPSRSAPRLTSCGTCARSSRPATRVRRCNAAGEGGSRRKSGTVPATVSPRIRAEQVRYLPWSVVRFSGRDQPWDVGRPRVDRRALPSVTTLSWNGRNEHARFTHSRTTCDRRHRLARRGDGERHAGQRHAHRRRAHRAARRRRWSPTCCGWCRRSRSSISGPAGSLTQVRIRGAEANHTLLFVDGIRANDPAAGNEPRFELLNADLASRIEVVRGPQSALWGSEAIGGVIAVDGAAPGSGGTAGLRRGRQPRHAGAAPREPSIGDADRGLSLGVAGQRSDGIDSFSGDGDKDGYRNCRPARSRALPHRSRALLLGASGFALARQERVRRLRSRSPSSHADTLDETRNRLAAGRLFAELGERDKSYAVASASLLGSSNRNFLDDDPVNRTAAHAPNARRSRSGTASASISSIAAIESERETFRGARYGLRRLHRPGPVAQPSIADGRMASAATWARSAPISPSATTSSRASRMRPRFARVAPGRSRQRHFASRPPMAKASPSRPSSISTASSPARFVGNPDLKPESSRGGEVSLRYSTRPARRLAHLLSPAAEGRDRRRLPARLPLDHRQRRRQEQAPGRRSWKAITSLPTRCA